MSFAPAKTLFDEITDCLIGSPTADEEIELDTFLKIGHLLTMLKTKAQLKL